MDVTAIKEPKSPESDWISPGDWITEKEYTGQSQGRSIRFFEYKCMSTKEYPNHVYAHPITPGRNLLVNREVNVLLEQYKYRKITAEEKSAIITRHIEGEVADSGLGRFRGDAL